MDLLHVCLLYQLYLPEFLICRNEGEENEQKVVDGRSSDSNIVFAIVSGWWVVQELEGDG